MDPHLDPPDPGSPDSPFEQLRAQIAARAGDGRLPPGTRLPTVRGLAAELGLAANTVARAYRELEADGVVQTRGRAGTVIASGLLGVLPRELLDLADGYTRAARRGGLTLAEALRTVEDRWGRDEASPPS